MWPRCSITALRAGISTPWAPRQNQRPGSMDPELGEGRCTLLKMLKTKKAGAMVNKGNSNITTKLKYTIIIPIYDLILGNHPYGCI